MTLDPIRMTQDLVRCPSITPTDAGAQDILVDILHGLGFSCERLCFGAVNNFFAWRDGGTGPHLCFAGHTDVVPPGDESLWSHPPFGAEIAGDFLYGRGASDMKGNIAAFVAAAARYDGPGKISLLITGDEEGPATDGTVKVLEWMAANGHIPDGCIVGEPSNPDCLGDEIKIGRRGSLSATLGVSGVQGHVAYPDRADNPIPKLAALIACLDELEIDTGSTHFGPSTLQFTALHVGNAADNVIPARASARFNIRFNDLWTFEALEAVLRDRLEVCGIAHDIVFTRGAESFLCAAGPLTRIVQGAVESVTGRVPVLSTGGGTSDARFIKNYCPVVECGLTNRTIHKIDECVSVSDLLMLTDIYSDILRRFLALKDQ